MSRFIRIEEEYRCSECGFLRVIFRNQRRKLGHFKTMLCPKCNRVRKFIL